jgi:acyl-CoA synthetase (NDP forming)
LKVPPFRLETRQKLAQVIPEAGAGVRNPVETTVGLGGMADFYHRGLKMVDDDPEIDVILIHMAVDVYGKLTPNLPQKVNEAAEALCEVIGTINKPVAVALFSGGHPETVLAVMQARDKLIKAGIPVYSGVESASRAINKYISYLETRRG